MDIVSDMQFEWNQAAVGQAAAVRIDLNMDPKDPMRFMCRARWKLIASLKTVIGGLSG